MSKSGRMFQRMYGKHIFMQPPAAGQQFEMTNLTEVKCPRCGWVHVAVSRAFAESESSTPEQLAKYYRCDRCGAPSEDFVVAGPDDSPLGCTIRGVVTALPLC